MMAAPPGIGVSGWLGEQLALAGPELIRQMVITFAQARRPGMEAAGVRCPDG